MSQDNQGANTGRTGSSVSNDIFERTYAAIKAQDRTNLRFTEEGRATLDKTLSGYLAQNYNERSGIYVKRFSSGEVKFITPEEQWQSEHDKHLNQDELKKYQNPANTDGIQKDLIRKIIDGTPALKGFSLEDAMAVADEKKAAVFKKYPGAPQNMIEGVAYTMLHLHKDEFGKTNPDFAKRHANTDFSDMAFVHALYAAEANPAYKQSYQERLGRVKDDILANPEIMGNINKLKAPQNLSTAEDVVAQTALRQKILEGVTDIYAKHFGVSTLDKKDVRVVYAESSVLEKERTPAYASSRLPGLANDELITYRYNPAFTLLTGIRRPADDKEERRIFLTDIFEEIEHAKDSAQADMLVSGKMNATHPDFQHTAYYTLNKLQYKDGSAEGVEYQSYANQYIEKTAKDGAKTVADGVLPYLENPALAANLAERQKNYKPPQPEAEESMISGILSKIGSKLGFN